MVRAMKSSGTMTIKMKLHLTVTSIFGNLGSTTIMTEEGELQHLVIKRAKAGNQETIVISPEYQPKIISVLWFFDRTNTFNTLI